MNINAHKIYVTNKKNMGLSGSPLFLIKNKEINK